MQKILKTSIWQQRRSESATRYNSLFLPFGTSIGSHDPTGRLRNWDNLILQIRSFTDSLKAKAQVDAIDWLIDDEKRYLGSREVCFVNWKRRRKKERKIMGLFAGFEGPDGQIGVLLKKGEERVRERGVFNFLLENRKRQEWRWVLGQNGRWTEQLIIVILKRVGVEFFL